MNSATTRRRNGWRLPATIVGIGILLLVSGAIVGRGEASKQPSAQAVAAEAPAPAQNSPAVLTPEQLEQRALSIAADRLGRDANQMEILYSATGTYPIIGVTARYYLIAASDSPSKEVLLDATGRELDEADLRQREKEARQALYGKMEPRLYELLQTTPAGEPIKIAVYLKRQVYTGPSRPAARSASDAEVQAYLSRLDDYRNTEVAALTAPIVLRLRALEYDPRPSSAIAKVEVTVRTADVATVASWDEVSKVMLAFDVLPQSLLQWARPSIGAHHVQNDGIDGTGVKIAQVEVSGRVAAHDDLGDVVQDTTYVCDEAADHATWVAGISVSTDSPHKGIALGATLLATGSCTTDNPNNYEEMLAEAGDAFTWGAVAVNLSWGADHGVIGEAEEPTSWDYDYDLLGWDRARAVIAAAGNTPGPVFSPSLGFNTISVGGKDDNDSYAFDDTMYEDSAYVNPDSLWDDREKPEVVAAAVDIFTTDTGGGFESVSGTSFPTAAVTAAHALLVDREPGLAAYPEAMRAILIASATMNIEGQARRSEYDGAGSIRVDDADDILTGAAGDWYSIYYTCSTSSPLDVATISLTAGKTFRAAIAWQTDPDNANWPSEPGANLNLEIWYGGTRVSNSGSKDMSWENVHFTPANTGNYTIRVVRPWCDDSPDWLGVAWWQKQ